MDVSQGNDNIEASNSFHTSKASMEKQQQLKKENETSAALSDTRDIIRCESDRYLESESDIDNSNGFTSGGDSSSSLGNAEDQEPSETDLQNKGWLVTLPSQPSACAQRQINGNSMPNDEATVFGEVNVKSSENVHLGSRAYYKGPVTINNYLSNHLTSVGECENSIKSTESTEHHIGEDSEDQDSFYRDAEPLHRLLYLDWYRTKRCVLIVCVVSILLLVVILCIYLLHNSNSLQQITTIPQPSTTEQSTTKKLIDIPSPPTEPFLIEQVCEKTVLIKWGKPIYDGGASLKNYTIKRADAKNMIWQYVDEVKADVQNDTIKNLSVGHKYFFRVYAKNQIGFSHPLESQNSISIKDSPSPPTEPIDIEQVSNDSVSISWRKPLSNGGFPLEVYKIDCKDVRVDEWLEVASVNSSIRKAIVDNLQINHEYYFRVRAKNKIGYSDPLEYPNSFEILSAEDVRIIKRHEWCAKSPKRSPKILECLPPYYVIISQTNEMYCQDPTTCKISVEWNQQQAMRLGHGDIDYNFLVGGDGYVYEGRGWDVEGNHTASYNNKSIGIAFLGNYVKRKPTENQIDIAHQLLIYGVRINKIASNYKLLGHKQVVKDSDNPSENLYKIVRTWEHWSVEP